MSDSLRPRELQHSSLPCPLQSPRVGSDSCPLSWYCHLILCHPLLLPAIFRSSGSFPMSQLFISGSQSIRASASGSVLPMNIQSWFPLGLTALISLLSKGPSRIFSNTTVQKHHVSVLYRLYRVSVQFSRVRHFVTPWTAACQTSLSNTNSQSLLKLMSIESVMPFNHLILCYPLLLLPSLFPRIRVISKDSFLCIRWPK